MDKRVVIGILIVGIVLFFGAINLFAQEDTVALDSSFGKVTFSHKSHSEASSCKECHHMGEVSQKCTSCHTADSDVNTQKAFHDNCITCHKEKEQGPTGCTECHKKE